MAWWRSITAILARSRAGSATTRPSRSAGCSSRACVMSWPGIVSITRTRAAARDREGVRAPAGPRAWCCARAPGSAARANGSARPPAATSRPSLYTRAGAKVSRSSSRTRSARRPGATAPRSIRPWQRAGCSVAISSAASGETPSSTATRHIWSMWPCAVEEVRLAVVGAERAVLGPVLADQRQQVAQVARVGGLAQQHPHAAAALLERLVERRRLVVGADAGGDVGVERPADHAGRVAVGVRRARHVEPREHVRRAGDDAGEVHHLGHAERPRVAQDRLHVGRLERAHGRLEVARRHARRRHHEDVERQVLGRLEHPLDALDGRARSPSRADR